MNFCTLKNASSVKIACIPEFPFADFRTMLLDSMKNFPRLRIAAFFAVPENAEKFMLYSILIDPEKKCLLLGRASVGKSYDSLTRENPAFQWFEREIREQYGIVPEGHPWLKPIRFQCCGGHSPEPGVTDYFTMRGAAAHEVAVGPVHAGVIEPGHFRFQCMGEVVYSLEIELGYQHRGVETLLENGPDPKTVHLIETAAGDTTASASFVFSSILESLSGAGDDAVSPRAKYLRTVALELERIANHVGDLGALAGDVAFLTTSSYCGRIRGEFLNMTALLCGNRFGRGYILPGGVAFDPSDAELCELSGWLARTRNELEDALALMFDSPSVLDRFENTGTLSRERALEIGLVGVPARASGLRIDVRRDLPYGIYEKFDIPFFSSETGDVLARALIRRGELSESLDLVRNLLENLRGISGEGFVRADIPSVLAPDSLGVSVCEAWRGELCHVCLTDSNGKIRRWKIVDPSFHNWFGLALALRDEQISNFPICNKSFNLSYCGHDL